MRFFFMATLFTERDLSQGKLARGHYESRKAKAILINKTLYVPQVQVLQDIIDRSACLVGALGREIHCATASGFLAALRLRRPCPLFLSFFFLLPMLTVSVYLQLEQFRARRGQLRFIDQKVAKGL